MRRVRQIENHCGVRFRAAAVRIRARKVNASIKVQGPIWIDIDIQRLEIRRSVDETDIARLNEIICDDDMFLIRSDFDVMRADGRLDFVGIVEAFDVVEVGNVERGDVIRCC